MKINRKPCSSCEYVVNSVNGEWCGMRECSCYSTVECAYYTEKGGRA